MPVYQASAPKKYVPFHASWVFSFAAEEDDATGIWKTDSFTRLATNHSQTQRSRPPGTQTSGGGGPLRCLIVFFE